MRPSAPNALTNPLLQSTSEYKAFRSLSAGFGSITSTASDGSPATFSSSSLGTQLIRVAGSPNPLGLTYQWSSINETAIKHGLGKVPIGYITVSVPGVVVIYTGTTSWDSTYIYLRSSDASQEATIMVF